MLDVKQCSQSSMWGIGCHCTRHIGMLLICLENCTALLVAIAVAVAVHCDEACALLLQLCASSDSIQRQHPNQAVVRGLEGQRQGSHDGLLLPFQGTLPQLPHPPPPPPPGAVPFLALPLPCKFLFSKETAALFGPTSPLPSSYALNCTSRPTVLLLPVMQRT